MKYIEKNQSQKAFQAIKNFKSSQKKIKKKPVYDDFSNEDGRLAVQESLLHEQGNICAYCMQRIDQTGKIEHWDGQSKNEGETLNYNNMLAVCRGKMGEEVNDFHCDTRRSKWQNLEKKRNEEEFDTRWMSTITLHDTFNRVLQ